MKSEASTGLRLPPQVRAAALAAVGGGQLKHEFAWMSWAGTVWRLDGDAGTVYVKRAADLAGERDRTVWLSGRLPVPEVLGMFHGFGDRSSCALCPACHFTTARSHGMQAGSLVAWDRSCVTYTRSMRPIACLGCAVPGTCSSTATTACPTCWSRTAASAASSIS